MTRRNEKLDETRLSHGNTPITIAKSYRIAEPRGIDRPARRDIAGSAYKIAEKGCSINLRWICSQESVKMDVKRPVISVEVRGCLVRYTECALTSMSGHG